MIKILIGDMFLNEAETLVNSVNCEGVMGKGVALEFKKRFPDMYKEYVGACRAGLVKTGRLTIHRNLFQNKTVINFPTKKHWRSPTLVKDIEDGLDYFIKHYEEWGIKTIAFPPLGCGNGGLTWELVGPLMYSKLKDLNIDITIYAPFGTSAEKLSIEFLESNFNAIHKKKGTYLRGVVNDAEILILETLYRLQKSEYAKPIGRVMYQKVCYILTAAGAPTGLVFIKNSYGPYSAEAKHSLTILANNNLTLEDKVGNMFRTKVTEKYIELRKDFEILISKNDQFIERAVDLIARIKDTHQGEEVSTVMHATKMLMLENTKLPTENEVLQYIFTWKKDWTNEAGRKASLLDIVEGLTMMGWIEVKISEPVSV